MNRFLLLVVLYFSVSSSGDGAETLTLKASFAPTLIKSSSEEAFVMTPRYDLCAILHPRSAHVVWEFLRSPPELEMRSSRHMEGFIPWIGYVGDASDSARLETSLKGLMESGLQAKALRNHEFEVFRLHGAAFGAFCARNVMGSKEFAGDVRNLKYWDDRHLPWVSFKNPERKRCHEWNQISRFLLEMHFHGQMREECIEIDNDVKMLICSTPESQMILKSTYLLPESDSVHGKILGGVYLSNPPKVTPQLIRQLETDFDNHYPDDLKRYLEEQFRKIEVEKR